MRSGRALRHLIFGGIWEQKLQLKFVTDQPSSVSQSPQKVTFFCGGWDVPWCVGDKEIIHTIKFSEGDGMGWALKYGLYVALGPVSVGDLALREHRDSEKEFMDKIWRYWALLFLILSVFSTSRSHKNPITPEENLHWVFLHSKKCPCPCIDVLHRMRDFIKQDVCLF